ncbi:MAG: ABC transporter permease [Lachnospiraceae bacterium]|nr:ABC transporter permease [Lachnospiraceae bacterium]
MFHLMLQKILHKKWMAVSLLIGNILLVAIAVSHPMYQEASRNRMLTDEFTNYIEQKNEYPFVVDMTGMVRKNVGKSDTEAVREFATTASEYFGLPEVQKIFYRNLVASTAKSTTIHDGLKAEQKISIGTLSGIEDHSVILSGEMYSDKMTDDGYIEAVISQAAMVKLNLLVGEELSFPNVKYRNKDAVKIRITGVFTNAEDNDYFWFNSPDFYNNCLMISPALFEHGFMYKNATKYQYNEHWWVLLDYTQLKPDMVDDVLEKVDAAIVKYKSVYSSMETPDYIEMLKDFKVKEKQISVTLTILQVPVIVLLCAFLFMISRQMLEMEENEIALLKSRGAGRGQIIRLYFFQSLFLSLISFIIGLPLGSLTCRILGAASAFLEFASRRNLQVEYSQMVFIYGGLAVLISTIMTLLPVFKRDKVTIVSVKRKRSRQEKPLWRKLFLDIIILGVAIYGLYTFGQQEEELLNKVLSGQALDPLIFLSASLFILGAGLFSLRIHSLLIKLFYSFGKKSWKPASYTSFLQLIRTGNKQAFIMVFLVLTVAFGMFNTTIARTILANAEKNSDYNTGADIVMKEFWKNNAAYAAIDPDVEITYSEPDFGKYGSIPGAKSIAKVYRNKNVTVKSPVKTVNSMIMGIDTKDFGNATHLDGNLLKYNYREYLNVLSKNSGAVLVSSNYRDKLGFKLGDKINYSVSEQGRSSSASGVIYGFVDYWPGYMPKEIVINPDETTTTTENYLIVAHLSFVQENIGFYPYEVWIDMDSSSDGFYKFVEDNSVRVTKLIDSFDRRSAISSEPLFQGTNGILTMSFITILLICSIGYLIYWTLSIRSRELLFGIFRAMGMSRSEIIHMLVNEQVFTGVVAIGFGLGIGWLASKLYVPIIQIAYSATDRSLPLELITETGDVVRLLVIIGIVFIGCLIALINQVFRMKISQALKLGED